MWRRTNERTSERVSGYQECWITSLGAIVNVYFLQCCVSLSLSLSLPVSHPPSFNQPPKTLGERTWTICTHSREHTNQSASRTLHHIYATLNMQIWRERQLANFFRSLPFRAIEWKLIFLFPSKLTAESACCAISLHFPICRQAPSFILCIEVTVHRINQFRFEPWLKWYELSRTSRQRTNLSIDQLH